MELPQVVGPVDRREADLFIQPGSGGSGQEDAPERTDLGYFEQRFRQAPPQAPTPVRFVNEDVAQGDAGGPGRGGEEAVAVRDVQAGLVQRQRDGAEGARTARSTPSAATATPRLLTVLRKENSR